jgi:hypothetical protein
MSIRLHHPSSPLMPSLSLSLDIIASASSPLTSSYNQGCHPRHYALAPSSSLPWYQRGRVPPLHHDDFFLIKPSLSPYDVFPSRLSLH